MTSTDRVLLGAGLVITAYLVVRSRSAEAAPVSNPAQIAPPFDATVIDPTAVAGSEAISVYKGAILQTWQETTGDFRGQVFTPCGVSAGTSSLGRNAMVGLLQAAVDRCAGAAK